MNLEEQPSSPDKKKQPQANPQNPEEEFFSAYPSMKEHWQQKSPAE